MTLIYFIEKRKETIFEHKTDIKQTRSKLEQHTITTLK